MLRKILKRPEAASGDTDCAAETAALARENILQEASGSILVTANHSSEMILSLLQN